MVDYLFLRCLLFRSYSINFFYGGACMGSSYDIFVTLVFFWGFGSNLERGLSRRGYSSYIGVDMVF